MVRRSSRLRDKARELNVEVSTVGSDEKDSEKEPEHLENLVQRAYALIKQKVEEDEENAAVTEKISDEEESSLKTDDYISIASKVQAQVLE